MGKHHQHARGPAQVRSPQQTRRDTHAAAAQAATEAARAQANLALLRESLMALAGAGEADLAETRVQTQAIDDTRAALATLERLAPVTLAKSPDLLQQMRALLSHVAQYTANLSPDLLRGSPTHSTPLASGQDSALTWTGMGAKRTDAIGVPNADYLRRLATRNPWVQAAITSRKQRIGRADIAVVPLDETRSFDRSVQRQIERLLNYPNELRDSYRSLIEPVIDDILTLDRGVISKDLDARGIPHHLYYEDGATIKIVADWNGDPRQPHYVYQPPHSMDQTPLYNEQLICVMANTASYRFGLSPVQVLLDTVRADIAATEKAMNLVRDVPPPHLVHLKGANEGTLKKLRAQYDMEIAGQRELLFMGWGDDINVYPMMFSLKDNQFLEWQEYLVRKICAVFQISPQELGITFDINKSTAQAQQEITESNGLIPLLLLIEEYWNRELVADYAKVDRDGRPLTDKLNIAVIFPEVSEVSRMLHAEKVMKLAKDGLAGLPSLTPNMALRMLGEEPIPGGNTLWVMTKDGPMPWLSYDGETGDYTAFATAGDLGAQSPAGGVDEDAADPRDVRTQKPDRTQPQFLGNESSANGDPPDSGTGDNPMPPIQEGTKAFAPWHDGRKPGKAWSPMNGLAHAPVQKRHTPKGRPKVTADARAKLEARARAIFQEVGKEKQSA